MIDIIESKVNINEEFTKHITDIMVKYINDHKDKIIPMILENIFIQGLTNSNSFQDSIRQSFEMIKYQIIDEIDQKLNK